MYRAIIINIIIMLVTISAFAYTQPVTLVTAYSSDKSAKPGDFVTVPFTLKSDSSESETFLLNTIVSESITMISSVKEITVNPGEEKNIALTFLVSGGSEKSGFFAEIKLMAESTSRKEVRAESSATIKIEARECAEIIGLPDEIDADGGQRLMVKFDVKNCGPSELTMDFNIITAPELTLFGKPESTVLEAGKVASFQFPVIPSEQYEEYKTNADIIVMSQRDVVTSRTVVFNVAKHMSESRLNNRQYIPINLKLDYKIGSGRKPATALKFVMPTFKENSISMRSETWASSGEDGFSARRSTSVIDYGDSGLTIGNQTTGTGKITGKNLELEGWKYSRSFEHGNISYFKGGDDSEEISEIKIEKTFLSDKVTIGAGRRQTDSFSDELIDFKTYNVFSNYKLDDAVTVYAEVANTHPVASALNGTADSGTAFRLSSSYRKNNVVINALTQKGSKGFIGNGFRDGMEIETVYKSEKSSFFAGLKRRTAWNLENTLESGSTKSYEYESRRAGWVLRQKKSGISTMITIQSDGTYRMGESIEQLSEKTATVQVSKKSKKLELGVKINFGVRSDGISKSRFRYTEFSGKYRWGDFVAGITSEMDLENRLIGSDNVANFLSQISYVPKHGKTSLHISHNIKSNKIADGVDTRYFQTSFRLDSKITRNLSLMMKYDIYNTSTGSDSNLSATFSRTFDLNVPYKKNGAISGITYIDTNKNGRYDSVDMPLKGVVFRVKDAGVEASSDSGRFEFRNLLPGIYNLIADRDSYPVGISPVDNFIPEVKIRSGKNKEVQIPFEPLYRLSGGIILDRSNPMIRFSNIGVAKIRITLKSGEAVVKEAYSDESGKYYFEQVSPGGYQIEMDREWLSADAVTSGTLRYNVVCGVDALDSDDSGTTRSGESENAGEASSVTVICDGVSGCDGFNFDIAPRPKKIIKTFTD